MRPGSPAAALSAHAAEDAAAAARHSGMGFSLPMQQLHDNHGEASSSFLCKTMIGYASKFEHEMLCHACCAGTLSPDR